MYDEEVFKKLVIGWLVMLPLGLFGGLVGFVTITVLFLLPAGIMFFSSGGFGVSDEVKWSTEFPKEGRVPYNYFGFDKLPLTSEEVVKQNEIEWKIRDDIWHWNVNWQASDMEKYAGAIAKYDIKHRGCIEKDNGDIYYRNIIHYDTKLKKQVVVKRQLIDSWKL